eukprot:scaffold85916_cov30-Tisochrysis_lutea.AAC.1
MATPLEGPLGLLPKGKGPVGAARSSGRSRSRSRAQWGLRLCHWPLLPPAAPSSLASPALGAFLAALGVCGSEIMEGEVEVSSTMGAH